ncbi:histidine kinase [Streptomyces sp. NPDC048564]|uniref:helix-turn-helix transcriptional regulator n=1 Tax=Streptomyces sp. NPDC048564 TaxID=3155760 RepID=UPI00341229DB
MAELVLVLGGRLRRPTARHPSSVPASALRLAALERRRLAVFHAAELDPPRTGQAAYGYVAARWPLGLFGLLVLLTSLIGLTYASLLVWAWFVMDPDHLGTVALSGLGGAFLLFLCAQGGRGPAQLDEQLARRHLGPCETELLRRRVGELAETRAGVMQAVHDERRRIERDLHDGVQQRLVALGMLLGRALRATDPRQDGRAPAPGPRGVRPRTEVFRRPLARADPLHGLTPRERDVPALMAQGCTNAAITVQLYVSQSAVEKHTDAIFDKFDLTGTTGYSRRVLAVLRHLSAPAEG